MARKNSLGIRIPGDLKGEWREACKAMDLPSPALFEKLWKSDNLKIKEKIEQEVLKKMKANKFMGKHTK